MRSIVALLSIVHASCFVRCIDKRLWTIEAIVCGKGPPRPPPPTFSHLPLCSLALRHGPSGQKQCCRRSVSAAARMGSEGVGQGQAGRRGENNGDLSVGEKRTIGKHAVADNMTGTIRNRSRA